MSGAAPARTRDVNLRGFLRADRNAALPRSPTRRRERAAHPMSALIGRPLTCLDCLPHLDSDSHQWGSNSATDR